MSSTGSAPTASPWSASDLTEFDPLDTDKVKIGRLVWVPCRVCWAFFGRARLTDRYCMTCERAYCEGEHGAFVKHGPAFCVRCRPAISGLS
jgi:hypothetical protein